MGGCEVIPSVVLLTTACEMAVEKRVAEEDEADPADEEFFQEQAGYDEFRVSA
uniref:Uncharacterized protein n=1 Tax=Oryza sativa subsp. japonica TaxID=39947 RepID=Q5VMK9_ORYSJ|nr:hypothetical protein [Oryza sativa Japonica Group]BAD69316.1 hypothetical protein [Oryza sativa Japonica Group]